MKKKLISLSVALLMIMQIAFPALAIEPKKSNQAHVETEPQDLSDTAFAEHTSTNDKADTKQDVIYDKEGVYNNLKYGISDGEVTITGYVSKPSGDLVIPEKIEGYPVTGIGDYAFVLTSITSVEMPNVQTIGYSAFSSCTSITSMEMPNVQTIGISAFYKCGSLTSVAMANVQKIGEFAFYYCDSLTSVEMPNVKEVSGNSFYGTPWYNKLTDEFAVFGDGVLVKYCGTAKEVTVPDNVKCVAGFYYNGNITSVDMPNVQIIGDRAFYSCDSLTSVDMPNVQTIGENAFHYCTSITSVEMPNVETIGDSAFTRCYKLTSFIISSDNTNYSANGGILYNKDKTTLCAYPSVTGDIEIADSVQTIGGYAFYDCNSLMSVEMANVQTIGIEAFCYCDALTSVKMPKAQTIYNQAFGGCKSLMSIEMQNIQTMGIQAFAYCNTLTRVEMPNVQTIGRHAFEDCASLTSAYFYVDAPTSFGSGVFEDCASDFTIYYAKSTSGWTTPTWRGYPTQEFTPTGYYYVTFIDGLTGEQIAKRAVKNGSAAIAPEHPVHEGYTFTGWDKSYTNVTSNLTVTAQYKINTYTVTFKDWDGTTLKTQSVNYGSSATAPSNPTRTGYTFTGWDKSYTNVTSNLTVTAQYKINTYTVTFKDWDGTTLKTQSVNYGSSATAPSNPTRTGYTFTGWDKSYTNVTSNLIVTAQYQAIVYTVTFVDGITDEIIDKQEVEYGKNAVLPTPPTHEGYIFNKWTSDGSNIVADTTITALYKKIDADTYMGLQYEVKNNEAIIIGYTSEPEGKLVIPEQLSGYTVTAIEDSAFYGCEKITSIEMPSVKKIGEYAFCGCSGLKSVSMPSVKTIGGSAFYYCTSLKSVEMQNVETVANGAFIGCAKLTSFIISSNNGNYSADGGILYNKDKTILCAYPSATGDINIADSVQTIDGYAFEDCSLTSVKMLNVQTIAERSFYNCINLESIILQNANAIGEAAFDSCTALVSIKIQKVKSIGGKAFMHCTALKSVELPNAVRIGESAFNGCTGLERIEMPNVKEIAAEAFRYCNSLESVNLPNLEKLGEYAFAACGCLRKAELTNVKTVDDRAFENCYSLEKIDILNVQTVGRGAFYNCTGIKTVVMAQVQSIHDKAFNSCVSMESAYFYADAPAKFGEEVFDGCADNFTIYCAKDTQGWTTPMWNGYPIKIFDPTSGEIIDGEFFTGDVNGDSKVNTADAVYLLKNAAGMLTLTSEQMQVADLNHDGKINTADAVLILRYAAGIITSFD